MSMDGEVVRQAEEKWDKVNDALAEVSDVLGLPCSFCDYYAVCGNCPLESPKGGCHDFFQIADKINEARALAQKISRVIGEVRDE